MQEKFPHIILEGSHYKIGLQHGRQLRERIFQSVDFYKKIWQTTDDQIFKAAESFAEVIQIQFPHYATEIEAIAEGAEIDPRWIYALNARSEILGNFRTETFTECTALYFKKTAILGQNWDWAETLENLAVLMEIRYPSYTILQMTEPGIIGKIGMNSYGIGVTLNLLKIGSGLQGVPIHILLRVILDSESVAAAVAKLEPHKLGKASNVIIGDGNGEYVDIEFAANRTFMINSTAASFAHTNHYIQERINTDEIEFASSFARYERAGVLMNATEQSVDSMKRILADQERVELPICRPYVVDELIGNVGTVCTIIMDLANRKLHITRGSPLFHQYEEFKVE